MDLYEIGRRLATARREVRKETAVGGCTFLVFDHSKAKFTADEIRAFAAATHAHLTEAGEDYAAELFRERLFRHYRRGRAAAESLHASLLTAEDKAPAAMPPFYVKPSWLDQ